MELAINADKLEAHLSGASELNLSGKADHVSFDMSGASDVNASDLSGQTGDLGLSGSSHLEVSLSEAMHVHASGASHVICHGNPVEKIFKNQAPPR